MRISSSIIVLFLCCFAACSPSSRLQRSSAAANKSFQWGWTELENPNGEHILVAAHRGDWRNAPENSIPALKNAIALGADIAEFDLKRTRDGVLVIMHDKTIDRTTDGKGKPEDYTWEELKKFRLRNGLGRPTENHIPTFSEYLDLSKGAILMDVDKGYDYYPEVVKILREKGMTDEAIINVDDNSTLDQVEARHGKVPEEIWLMPIVDFKDSARAVALVESYRRHKRTVFQPVWSDDRLIASQDFVKLRKAGFGIWLNSLWPSLNGGHDDDRAVESGDTDNTWGWLIERGATIMQTDRPMQLLGYLEKKGYR